MGRGYWRLEITGVDDLTDVDREHIAQLINDGFTSGEIAQENEEPEEEIELGVL